MGIHKAEILPPHQLPKGQPTPGSSSSFPTNPSIAATPPGVPTPLSVSHAPTLPLPQTRFRSNFELDERLMTLMNEIHQITEAITKELTLYAEKITKQLRKSVKELTEIQKKQSAEDFNTEWLKKWHGGLGLLQNRIFVGTIIVAALPLLSGTFTVATTLTAAVNATFSCNPIIPLFFIDASLYALQLCGFLEPLNSLSNNLFPLGMQTMGLLVLIFIMRKRAPLGFLAIREEFLSALFNKLPMNLGNLVNVAQAILQVYMSLRESKALTFASESSKLKAHQKRLDTILRKDLIPGIKQIRASTLQSLAVPSTFIRRDMSTLATLLSTL